MTEKQILQCWDNFTIKCYKILKQVHWKKYALESILKAPIFRPK